MGGFDLCRELRARSAQLPIIFLTARESELDAVSALRLGADDYRFRRIVIVEPGSAEETPTWTFLFSDFNANPTIEPPPLE